jgi:hypothetical protein
MLCAHRKTHYHFFRCDSALLALGPALPRSPEKILRAEVKGALSDLALDIVEGKHGVMAVLGNGGQELEGHISGESEILCRRFF